MTSKISPFSFVLAITETKENLFDNEEVGKQYNSFLVLRALSYHVDCVHYANEMNQNHELPNDMQFEFLKLNIPPKKRYSKWEKRPEILEDLNIIRERYECSMRKAGEFYSIFTEPELEVLRKMYNKGGIQNESKGKS